MLYMATAYTCLTYCRNFTAGVREFGELEPNRQLHHAYLLTMTLSNVLNIAINHRLISWGATFCCCQMW